MSALDPVVDEAAAAPAEARELSQAEAAIRRQVSHYFSDENLSKGDDYIYAALAESGDLTLSLKEISVFKKMKKLVPSGDIQCRSYF